MLGAANRFLIFGVARGNLITFVLALFDWSVIATGFWALFIMSFHPETRARPGKCRAVYWTDHGDGWRPVYFIHSKYA